MVINQGDIYWYTFPTPKGSQPMGRRPVVVVQNNMCNRSKVNTVIVCPLTTNLRLALAPGNVLLENGESKIPQQSVINVSQVQSIDKSFLKEYVGTLSTNRIHDVIRGLQMWITPREPVNDWSS